MPFFCSPRRASASRSVCTLRAGFLSLVLPLVPGLCTAQELPPDSSELLREAREAQREFEHFHRSRLNRTLDTGTGNCDEWVGRICLRWSGGGGWNPTSEDSTLVAAREDLLVALEGVGRQIPGDRWVLGQRIRYLGHIGRWEEASTLAGNCQGGEAWWCAALQGYVLHRSGQGLEAAEAFQRALEQMPLRQAEGWRDPGELLEYPASRWVRNPEGIPRGEALDLFWRLADPLFLTPGNERLTEHFSRIFGASLYEDSALTLGVPWGGSLEELLIRYGFIAGWERGWPEMSEVGGGGVVEHHHPESRGLLPPVEALEDPSGLPRGVWVPRDDRPRSASTPVLAPLLVEGLAQTAVLRREGDLLVVGAYATPTDTLLQQRRQPPDGEDGRGGARNLPPPWEVSREGRSPDTLSGLFLLADTGSWAPMSVFSGGGEGILQLRAPPGGYLLSMEVWHPAGGWAARTRHGIQGDPVPPDVPVISDLLLLEPAEDLPEALAQALPRMRAGTEVTAGEVVTVAWEVYGLGRRREPLSFRVSLVEEEGSLIRRALKRIGLFARAPALTISWAEGGTAEVGPLFRAVDVELPPLASGRYVLRLEMEIPNRSKVVSHRRITVR